jgi:hypothetical protein
VRRVERGWIRFVLRVGFAALAVVAIVAQMLDLIDRGVLDPVNFFSYFTIQSNLIAVAALLWAAIAQLGRRSRALEFVRGAATTYMTVTFVVFALLLADTDVDTAIEWVDRVLHRVIPIVMVVDWLTDPPQAPIDFRRALWWIAYPVAWVAYTMVRGAIVGRYPYPFLDPANGGYGVVALYCVAILVLFVAVVWVTAWAGTALRARRIGPDPEPR